MQEKKNHLKLLLRVNFCFVSFVLIHINFCAFFFGHGKKKKDFAFFKILFELAF